jgi:hypothetical protein
MRFVELKVAVVSLLVASIAWAAPLLPYQGRLDKNGKPLNGNYDLTFALYDAPSAGNLLWQDTFSGVAVVTGAFSVKLGSGAALDPSVLRAPAVYVAISVRGPGEMSFTTLAGRQQVLTTPYATQSQQDFYVPRHLDVGSSQADAGVTITGAASNGTTAPLQIVSGATHLAVDGQALDSIGTLQLQTKTGNGTQVGGSLNVTGVTTATGAINANGGLNAPNIWTKVYDNGGMTGLGAVTWNVKNDTTYKIVVSGEWAANSTGGNIVLRLNGISSGYKSWLRSDGDYGGWWSDGTGIMLSWDSNLTNAIFTNDVTVSINSAGYGLTATGSHTEMETTTRATYLGYLGGSLQFGNAVTPSTMSIVCTTIAGISAVHVMVFTTNP